MATTKVDQFGRVLIPKPVRDGLGLEPGRLLTVEEQGNAILLRPVEEEMPLAVEDGVLVFTGEAIGDLIGVVRKQRERRTRQVLAMDAP